MVMWGNKKDHAGRFDNVTEVQQKVGKHLDHPDTGKPAKFRRPDFKGDRVQMVLRVSPELKEIIDMLAFAKREYRNDMCVAILEDVAHDAFGKLKERPDWKTIEAAFEFNQRR